MSMREKIAQAITETDAAASGGGIIASVSTEQFYLSCADAVLAAMREPDEAMIRTVGAGTRWVDPTLLWQAMIDAAAK